MKGAVKGQERERLRQRGGGVPSDRRLGGEEPGHGGDHGRQRDLAGVPPTGSAAGVMPDVSATDAARHFADLLDGVEHRGEHYTIVRRGKAAARLEPVSSGRRAEVKSILRRHPPDSSWPKDLADLRALVEIQDRG